MRVEVDLEVYKALTIRLLSEDDSYNGVIRRLLGLSDAEASGIPDTSRFETTRLVDVLLGNEARNDGVWLGNTFFPDGTEFRATYKGRTYTASIVDGRWVGEDGQARTSPSDAASAISNTNVNGWRFWFALLPGEKDWRRLDELRP